MGAANDDAYTTPRSQIPDPGLRTKHTNSFKKKTAMTSPCN